MYDDSVRIKKQTSQRHMPYKKFGPNLQSLLPPYSTTKTIGKTYVFKHGIIKDALPITKTTKSWEVRFSIWSLRMLHRRFPYRKTHVIWPLQPIFSIGEYGGNRTKHHPQTFPYLKYIPDATHLVRERRWSLTRAVTHWCKGNKWVSSPAPWDTWEVLSEIKSPRATCCKYRTICNRLIFK